MIQHDEDLLNSLNTSEEGPHESEIVVGVWDYTCWKCHQRTPVIEWSWQSGEGQMWTEDDRIGQKLQQTFPFYGKDYTWTADAYYYCNHCGSCGAVQGDWFVSDWVAQERAIGHLPVNVVKLKMDFEQLSQGNPNERDLVNAFFRESTQRPRLDLRDCADDDRWLSRHMPWILDCRKLLNLCS